MSNEKYGQGPELLRVGSMAKVHKVGAVGHAVTDKLKFPDKSGRKYKIKLSRCRPIIFRKSL